MSSLFPKKVHKKDVLFLYVSYNFRNNLECFGLCSTFLSLDYSSLKIMLAYFLQLW